MKNPAFTFNTTRSRLFLQRWVVGFVLCAGLMCAANSAMAQTNASQDWQPGQPSVPQMQSDPHDNVRQLLRQAKYPQALVLVDNALKTNPNDPQMRFWQAFLVEQMGQASVALPLYLSLTQDYPELAEPHNNLGVLYAAQGDYARAKVAIEAALRANPNYAAAHENMGDLMVQMARQSYERALRLEPAHRAPAKKIEALQPALALTQGSTP
ncbi:tetratricopeptide repeat protein [Limnohabitans sp.]|uniref:tetratricopeptide repeat protein n=1 Tax=Limnohabitans sp. TaxID=1907725 RepID=UPI00286EE40E|nr:tetratricopeptide repeat protein [Limnohabitans sp.]